MWRGLVAGLPELARRRRLFGGHRRQVREEDGERETGDCHPAESTAWERTVNRVIVCVTKV